MTKRLTLGILHLAPELGALEQNRALVEAGTRLAADLGADWVISGELVVAGYRFPAVIGTDWIVPQPDPWMRRLAALSADLGVASFVSHPERDSVSGQLYNTLFAIGRDGRILGRQRKLHPIPGSEDWARPGHQGDPVIVDDFQVGLLVCADAYPRQPALRLRDAGAQLLVSAAAWWPGEWGPNGEWEARTLDTDVPLIVCNRTGHDGASSMIEAESVLVDRGVKILSLRSPGSKVFVIDCLIEDGHLVTGEVVTRAI
jgi:5-aminopentanamidase